MNQNLEIEYKNLLSELEYKKLFKAFNFNETQAFSQENCYFDSEEFLLKQHKMALRIRTKQNSAEMTLKTPHQGHLLETNHPLTIDAAHKMIESKRIKPLGDIATILKANHIDSSKTFSLIARLRTKRVEKKIGNCLLVLDQSWYADQVDYELEIESSTAEEGTTFISDLLSKYSIPERETSNKISRAMQYMVK